MAKETVQEIFEILKITKSPFDENKKDQFTDALTCLEMQAADQILEYLTVEDSMDLSRYYETQRDYNRMIALIADLKSEKAKKENHLSDMNREILTKEKHLNLANYYQELIDGQ